LEFYDQDYFERGIETGKSCYQNYRWIPELTIPMAMTIIDYLDIKAGQKILDFGCAKGYLVKAFRWLRREAWGIDSSKYAICNCDTEVEDVCFTPMTYDDFGPGYVDVVIAKDVFEHILLTDLSNILEKLSFNGLIFAVIPLGDGGLYRAPANNLDQSHITCLNEKEWKSFFRNCNLRVENFTFRVDGIKDSYYDKYPTAHGFFTLKRR